MRRKRRVLLILFFAVTILVFIQLHSEQPILNRPTSFLDRAISYITMPLLGALTATKRFFIEIWKDYIFLIGLKKQNAELKDQLHLKELTILSLKERLRVQEREGFVQQKLSMLGLQGVTAKVIGFDPYARVKTIWISKGGDQGIQVDQAVIALEGLVGRIYKVLPHSSQVLALIDPHFAVDALDETSRVRALVVGAPHQVKLKRYPQLTHLEYLRIGSEISTGDLFLTSGMGFIYPPAIPIGNIVELEKGKEDEVTSAKLLPLVDFNKLEEVIVLTQWVDKRMSPEIEP